MVVFTAVVMPHILTITLPLLVMGACLRQYNIRTFRPVKRIEAASKMSSAAPAMLYSIKKTIFLHVCSSK